MTPVEATQLRLECTLFCRYLTGMEATEYVLAKYVAGHAAMPALRDPSLSGLDRALVTAARGGLGPTRRADAYARFFRPGSPIRQKLVLVLAISENAPGLHDALNTAETRARWSAVLQILLILAAAGLTVAAAIIQFGPVHLASHRQRSAAPARNGVVATAANVAVGQPVGAEVDR